MSFEQQPVEIILEQLAYLDYPNLINFSRTNKNCHNMCYSLLKQKFWNFLESKILEVLHLNTSIEFYLDNNHYLINYYNYDLGSCAMRISKGYNIVKNFHNRESITEDEVKNYLLQLKNNRLQFTLKTDKFNRGNLSYFEKLCGRRLYISRSHFSITVRPYHEL